MFRFLSNLLPSRTGSVRRNPPRRVQLGIEVLEERFLPSVSLLSAQTTAPALVQTATLQQQVSGGQGLLAAPPPTAPLWWYSGLEVQPIFLGADWNGHDHRQCVSPYFLEDFLNHMVADGNGAYVTMLDQAYTVVGLGEGSSGLAGAFVDQPKIDGAPTVNGVPIVDKIQGVTIGQVTDYIYTHVQSGNLPGPENALYVVFVEDNVSVFDDQFQGSSPRVHFGYVSSVFNFGTDDYPFTPLNYVVIPYPSSYPPYASYNTMDKLTLATSCEFANAVLHSWSHDGIAEQANQVLKAGDLGIGHVAYLNGYAVQRVADPNGQLMTPAGATSASPVNFVLLQAGALYLSRGSGLTFLNSGVTSLSDQGIDQFGRATVDVVDAKGQAWSYTAGSSSGYQRQLLNSPIMKKLSSSGKPLANSGVKEAKAGQDGVSYVLFADGNLWEYHAPRMYSPIAAQTGTWTFLMSNVGDIDAGTDYYGVNMVAVTTTEGARYYSDTSGWHSIAPFVKFVSAGQQGWIDYITNNNDAYQVNDMLGLIPTAPMGSGVAQITAGTDVNGNYMPALVCMNTGAMWELRNGEWIWVDIDIVSISKAHHGVVDMVYNASLGSTAWAHDDLTGWHYLAGGVKTAT